MGRERVLLYHPTLFPPAPSHMSSPDDSSLASILGHLPDIVLRYDRDGRVLFVNDAIEHATGRAPSYYIGRRAREVSVSEDTAQRFDEARATVLVTREPLSFEITRTMPDGPRTIEYRMLPECDASGEVVSLLAIGRDVTDARSALDALRAEEARYRSLVDSMTEIVWRAGPHGQVRNVDNPEWTHYTGQRFEERDAPIEERWLADVHPDDRAAARERWLHAVRTGAEYENRYRLKRADGSWRSVVARGLPVRGTDGAIAEWIGTIHDVTEREDALAALELERARLREAQHIARLGWWMWDLATGTSHSSPEIWQILGAEPGDAPDPVAMFQSLVATDDRERLQRQLEHITNDRPATTEGHWHIVRPDGVRRLVHVRSRWRYDETGVAVAGSGTLQDITEMAESEARFARQQALLAESQRIAHVGSWEIDLVTGETIWSDEMYRITGFSPADGPVTLESVRAMMHPDDYARTVRGRLEAGDDLETPIDYEHRILRPDGAVRVLQGRAHLFTDANGVRTRIVGTAQDVTELRAAADALRLSREQQLALLQSIPDAAWMKDKAGRYLAANEAALRLHGLTSVDEMLGRTALDVFGPTTGGAYEAVDLDALAAGHAVRHEDERAAPGGGRRWIETLKAPYYDAKGEVGGTVGIARDITERRRLEDQARQSQKMEALGLLAGSIAHDFNNLLSTILGGTELARLDVPDGTQLAADLDDVRRAAERAAQLTRQLLAFSRAQARRVRALDVRTVVRDAEKLLRRLLPEEIALDLVVGSEPGVVRADQSQIEQVVMNLVVNARDAVLEARRADASVTGIVTVETGRVQIDARDRRFVPSNAPPLDPGEYVTLTVRDTGVGIPSELLARIFEPFFTTKAVGEGTGLGLATVFGIARQSGGAIHVESALGSGARFTLLLPAIDEPADLADVGVATLPRGSEKILLVEDETLVRETATRILERHGYRVLAVRHGADALQAWEEDGDSIDLLLTDLRMPTVGGPAVVEALRATRPSLPVIVMSGYASGNRPEEQALLARERYLPKPFTAEALLRNIREAIDEKR